MPNNNNENLTKIAWNITNINESMTEIYIYDTIAEKQSVDWWTGIQNTEITPKLFAEELKNVTTPEMCIRINSGGGDVFAAEAIRTQIREKRAYGKKITCKIDGICASAAVGIAAACESIAIPSSAYFMIHDPSVFTYGYYTSADFEKDKIMLDKVKQGIINAYAIKTKKDKQEISDLMSAETWYTGDEAVENGFCDELMFEDITKETTSNNPVDLCVLNTAMYRNCPPALLNSRPHSAAVKHITNKAKKGDETKMEIKTVDDLRAAYPDLTNQIAEQATNTERKRIQDIENIALPGFEEVVNNAKFEESANAADVAIKIIAEQQKQGKNYLDNRNQDVQNSGTSGVEASGTEDGNEDKVNPFDAIIDSIYPLAK